MNEMIEKVAKAIANSHGNDYDLLPSEHGPGYGLKCSFINSAKAAIQAMREPTDDMLKTCAYSDSKEDINSVKSSYQKIIDAALKE